MPLLIHLVENELVQWSLPVLLSVVDLLATAMGSNRVVEEAGIDFLPTMTPSISVLARLHSLPMIIREAIGYLRLL
jgi:hypothetical protein